MIENFCKCGHVKHVGFDQCIDCLHEEPITRNLHLMVGLPRSGKSTKAKELGFPIVEPDAIRQVLHGSLWRSNAEPMVWGIAHMMVESLFKAGHSDVILDATNHTEHRRNEWKSELWVNVHHEVLTDIQTCKQRAIETNQEYLIPVIDRMNAEYVSTGD